MAEYGANVIICNDKYKSFEGDRAVLSVSVRKANARHRLVRFRSAKVYLDLLELDYVREPSGIPDFHQEIRRRQLVLSIDPDELFALADYVRSQLAPAPPAEMEDAASDEVPE